MTYDFGGLDDDYGFWFWHITFGCLKEFTPRQRCWFLDKLEETHRFIIPTPYFLMSQELK